MVIITTKKKHIQVQGSQASHLYLRSDFSKSIHRLKRDFSPLKILTVFYRGLQSREKSFRENGGDFPRAIKRVRARSRS